MFLICSSSLNIESQRESQRKKRGREENPEDFKGWHTACILLKLGDFPAKPALEIR